MAGQQTTRAGIDIDLDINFESWLATSVDHATNAAGLVLSFQFRLLRPSPLDALSA
jgi:hypothetical protein